MMHERHPRRLQTVKVDHYDGQAIYSNNELIYELGGYLGGGAAGVVYEAFCMRTKHHVAIKILNPVGYKLLPSTLLARCIVAVKGKPLDGASRPLAQAPTQRGRSSNAASSSPMRVENVWWLVHPTTKQAIAAVEDPRTGALRELTLPQCIEVWGAALGGADPSTSAGAAGDDDDDGECGGGGGAFQEVEVKNQVLRIPTVPKKFLKFAFTRRSIHREVANMSGLDFHENVLRLDAALELVQDSKCTTFLDLLKCLRFDKFRKWAYQTKYSDDDPAGCDAAVFPSWFFPPRFSREAKSLIAQLLYPDPCMRLAVDEAQRHPWVLDQRIPRAASSPNALDESPAANSPRGPVQSPPTTTTAPAAPLSYKHRSSVVVNVPQSTIDQEHRWSGLASARSGLTSPLGFGCPLGVALCPPSPQKNPRPLSLAGGGYMPSVDEETSLAPGHTPPTSPHSGDPIVAEKTQSLNLREAEDAAGPLQFELERDEYDESEGGAMRATNAVAENSAELLAESAQRSSNSPSETSSVDSSSSSREAISRRFISPPLALEAHGPMFHRSNQHRRNSPSELYLARFEKNARLEELRPFNLELLDLNCASSALASTPTGESGGLALSPLDEPPPTGTDHVTRSTHFTTALPAQLVLAKIETILAANPSPLPYPYKNVPQRVTVDWPNYLLEVRYGSVLTCTVQVFLYQRGVYLVEFRRGQVEIFRFKRFYEDIREKISASMTSGSCDKESARPSTSRSSRKRNKSVSTGSSYY
ncbi:hypothetical protein PybrP1_012158 [[Pythium] brassicae (nom. inval.)]|nr:hypothetical protein PybrP1_012158 [[Pythium] brassicae (nom. inval.)]